ncbi:MAG: enoyl-CoA hydratase [Gammaproteobacteria bacterium]|nr:enoyl-CoA hydratase [Gammaproteobacteria bacterium]
MSDVLFNLENKVLTITFNRPEKLNAIGKTVTPVAIERIREAVTDPAVGAIVLTGAGRAFCAGGDVSQMGSKDAGTESPQESFEDKIQNQRESHALPFLLHDIPKVTIAAVNGHAMGAGLGIAASCDLRLSSEKGKFGTAFANVGFGGDFGTTWQLTRLLGESKAKELFFLPDIIDAQEALRIGLVNRVLPEENFMGQVKEIAERLANGPLISYRWMKENINLSSHVDFQTMLDKEAVSHLRCGQTEDHKEGVAAFMQKRQANFKGR